MKSVFLWCVAIFVAIVLAIDIDEPFWGHHEFNGVYYGTIARNYLRYGLVETKGAQIDSFGEVAANEWSKHLHHPAAYPVLLSVWESWWGQGEWQIRSLSILASVVGVVGLVKLNWMVYGKFWSGVVVLPLALTPLFLYYGSMPVFETVLLPVVVWGLYWYWRNREKKLDLMTPGFVFVAFLIDWPGFWLGWWLLAVEVWRKKRVGVMKGLVLALSASGLLIVVHQIIVSGSIESLLEAGASRLEVARVPYSLGEWVQTLVSRTKAFWGLPILLTAGVGGVVSLYRKQRNLVLVAGILGVSHILVFRNITWYHDYMLYHMIPVVVLGLGAFVSMLEQVLPRSGRNVWIAAIIGLMAIMTVVSTHKFWVALETTRFHGQCVEFGKNLSESGERLVFEGSYEEVNICPPFIGFYGDRKYESRIIE